jgi:RNA polymerase sigma-70 factor, ECF subfamily
MSNQSKYHVGEVQMLDELEMIQAAKKNRASFAPLYEKYHEQIFRFVYQRMDDKEMAFDITSQVFLKAMLHLHKYEFKGLPFGSWLYRIARSEVYQLFKENKAERTISTESEQISHIFEEIKEDQSELYHQRLIQVIKELPEAELQLVEMRFFENKLFREIGEILEITENNAKVRLYRVLDKLKNLITAKS